MGQIKINDLIVLDIDIIKWLHFFDLTHFRSLGQKSKNNFIPFFGINENRKICFQNLLTFSSITSHTWWDDTDFISEEDAILLVDVVCLLVNPVLRAAVVEAKSICFENWDLLIICWEASTSEVTRPEAFWAMAM